MKLAGSLSTEGRNPPKYEQPDFQGHSYALSLHVSRKIIGITAQIISIPEKRRTELEQERMYETRRSSQRGLSPNRGARYVNRESFGIG